MLIREKIKLLRQSRKWSQEYLAEKLGMSANGYGEIERGHSRMTFEKLEELSQLFEVPLNELCDDESTNIFIAHNHRIQAHSLQNNQRYCTISASPEYVEIKHKLEKQELLNAEKDKEIVLLKRIIELQELVK